MACGAGDEERRYGAPSEHTLVQHEVVALIEEAVPCKNTGVRVNIA
jgi:hypothetical protein